MRTATLNRGRLTVGRLWLQPRAMTDDASKAELIALLQARTFKRGRFTLASGRESRIYFNMKATMMHPRGARLCAEGLLGKLDGLDADYVSGLEMGAVPLLGAVAALSDQQGQPVAATFVRKSAKGHGTRVLVEGLDEQGGESLSGKRVVLIDDVATTGGAMMQAAGQIEEAGGRVTDAIVIVDREEGASEALAERGIRLHALVTASDLGVTDADRAPF
jgi:orotate phosphoribosyltransferase